MSTMDEIISYLKDNDELFNRLIEELDSYCGYLYDDRYYPMDELPDLLYGKDIMDVLNMAYYGSFCPNDEYFRVDGSGNLESADYIDYSDHLDKYFVEELMENMSNIDINDDKLEYMLKSLKEE